MSNAPRGDQPSWRPSATPDTLRHRARALRRVRAFFARRRVMEVTTPVWLPAAAPERHQTPPSCSGGFLQTSPETCMKRLVAAGSGAIYQIGPAFRAGESGRLHHPEFTMLEWYRPQWRLEQLMEEVIDLLRLFFPAASLATMTFQEAFLRHAGVDPFFTSVTDMAQRTSVPHSLEWTEAHRPILVDQLFVDRLEPAFSNIDNIIILKDFPSWEPGMAELDPGPPMVARRFEIIYKGVEIANGYQELRDPVAQRERFVAANRYRVENGMPPLPLDERFLEALRDGFPPCAGVALGLDRLLMLAFGLDSIGDVLSFREFADETIGREEVVPFPAKHCVMVS
ncbi:MAG: EF-P lysine aminoacylase GenX [Magnetococcales bacterium]|nr:EF-P lysine aminoacylase GenX [Magnetococcales bacterium]